MPGSSVSSSAHGGAGLTLVLVSFLMAFATSSVRAQSWTPLPTFNGGNWTACAAGPSGEMYVISDFGTLHRSTDQGASWANRTPNGVRAVTGVCPVSGPVVLLCATYVGVDGDPSWLDLSQDDGDSWTQVQVSASVTDPFVALVSDGAYAAFAVTRTGNVWKSTDQGYSWSHVGAVPLPGGATVHDLLSSRDPNPLLLEVATDAGVYSSSDGASWSQVAGPLPDPVLHLAPGPGGGPDYLSTASATYALSDGAIQVAGVGGCLCTLSDGSLLIAGAYRLSGITLTTLPHPPLESTNQVAVVSGSTLLAATSEGVLRSTDNAQTWSDVAPVTAVPVQVVGSLGAAGALAIAGDAVYATASPGAPLQRTGMFGSQLPFSTVATSTGCLAATRNGGVILFPDAVSSPFATSHDFSGANVLAMVRAPDGRIVVGENGATLPPFWWSTDDGGTWTATDAQDPDSIAGRQITALAASGTTIYAATNPVDLPLESVLFASFDGAQTWHSLSSGQLPFPVTQLVAASTSQLFAIAQGELYRSTDGGATWTVLLGGGVQSMLVDALGQLWITQSGAPTVRVSVDNGGTWLAQDAGTSGVNSLALTSSNELYAGGLGGWHRSLGTQCPVAGLVAWWPAEGLATDLAGGHHNGVLNNGATFAAGRVGTAFSLDGVNDNVSVADNGAFDFTQAMSVEGWINTTSGIDRYIATKHEDSFYFAVGGGAVAPHKLSFWLNGVSSAWFSGATTVDDGQWHHVAATYDGATMSLYVDGHLDASAPRSGNIQAGGSAVLIGARSDGSNVSNFPGRIDELGIYDRAMGPGEIQVLAAGNTPCATVGVGDAPVAAAALTLAPPWPNPASGAMHFEFRIPGDAPVRADIFDLAGHLVSRPLPDQRLAAGVHRFAWDGRSRSGARAVPGVYFVRVRSGATTAARRVVLVH